MAPTPATEVNTDRTKVAPLIKTTPADVSSVGIPTTLSKNALNGTPLLADDLTTTRAESVIGQITGQRTVGRPGDRKETTEALAPHKARKLCPNKARERIDRDLKG